MTIRWLEDETDETLKTLVKGDMIWLETPQNPRGEVADLFYYRTRVAVGVILACDATFAPPPIQCLLSHGADIVMHSSTKFLGGHSDLLGGVLMTKDAQVYKDVSSIYTNTHRSSSMIVSFLGVQWETWKLGSFYAPFEPSKLEYCNNLLPLLQL